MKKIKWLALCVVSAVMVMMLAACQSGQSGATAATVNGTAIPEKEITDAIEGMRSQSEEWQDPAQWATALQSSGLTPEDLRKQVIDSKARDILLLEEAKAKDITADEAVINEQIEQTKQSIGGDEAEWTEALQKYGYPTEADYRKTLETGEITNQLYEAYAAEPTEDELKEYVVANLSQFLISQATAASEAAAAAEGEGTDETATDPADPAASDGTDEAAAPADEAATEETPAAEEPAAPATDPETGYTVPEDGVVVYDDVPAALVDKLKAQWAEQNKSAKFQEWLDGLVEAADIVINDMPADVPYNVDMSLASESTEDGSANTLEPKSTEESVAAAEAAGIQKTDTVEGDGAEVTPGATVKVLYTGTFEDGTVFDSTSADGEPREFSLSGVIAGWSEGLQGMKVGGQRHLIVPPSAGYGPSDTNGIPGNSVLIFDVELVDVTPAS